MAAGVDEQRRLARVVDMAHRPGAVIPGASGHACSIDNGIDDFKPMYSQKSSLSELLRTSAKNVFQKENHSHSMING
jgi:hypothetical protein